MARPIKDGVDYFPLDTGFFMDDKVRLLKAEFGAKGMYLLVYLLCEIYRKDGYFMRWDRNRCLLVSEGAACGCSPDFVEELVAGCLRCSFFDERVASVFGVLTSSGIQRRYVRMFNNCTFLYMNSDYFLLDLDNPKDIPVAVRNKLVFVNKTTENPDKTTENPDKTTENPTKEKKKKKKNNFVIQKNFKNKKTKSVSKYGDFSPDEAFENAMRRTYEKYSRFEGFEE